jgi:tetratricopeptide (TPR) repeat protein
MTAKSAGFRNKHASFFSWGIFPVFCFSAAMAMAPANAIGQDNNSTPDNFIQPVEDSPPMPAPVKQDPQDSQIRKIKSEAGINQNSVNGSAEKNNDAQKKAEPIVPPKGDKAEFKATGVTESKDKPDADLYYDSATIPEVTGLPREAGPRKPDPRKEPASKFIVVKTRHDAGSLEAQITAAKRALRFGRLDSAIDMYEKLLERNSRDSRILMGLAVAYHKDGRDHAAIRTYKRLLDIYPDNVDARANYLGLVRKNSPAQALRDLLAIREDNPTNPGVAAQIGLAHADLGNYRDAMKYLGTAASLAPADPTHLYNMAVVADMAGDKSQAVKYYEKALEADAVEGKILSREAIYDRLAVLRR